MKNYKQIITRFQEPGIEQAEGFNELLWQLICYSPRIPVRLQQEQLLDETVKFTLPVMDEFFTGTELLFNGFVWGSGKRKILITHGWGSKAADFTDIITRLRLLDNVQIIGFDAPGNGSSEGGLSNLLLYIQSVKAIVANYGNPDVVIGHSLGAMANVIAFTELQITPALLVSLTPLIRLKENFEATMSLFGVSKQKQADFLTEFEAKFKDTASSFNLFDKYDFGADLNHWLAYDVADQISPYAYMKDFLDINTSIKNKNYEGVGHDKILRSPELIDDLEAVVAGVLNK
ncbi:MAG: alpha/beta hydrolase [Mucilaginibacter sp.]|uniref:alpha/beta fold hydrolase n=1 Tax=Mucilaginibacter sp. TaxID=1882438 RepID=UPI00326751C2